MYKKRILISLIIMGLLLIFLFNIIDKIEKSKYGKFIKISDMNIPRANHKSFLLNDGRVLMLGGGQNETLLNDGKTNIIGHEQITPEIYDPKMLEFKLKNKTDKKIYKYSLVLLRNDKILISGGEKDILKTVKTSKIYDPSKDKLIDGPNLNLARELHTSVCLKDGRILVFGGITGEPGKTWFNNTAEIYDPKLNKFTLLKNTPHFIYDNPANVNVLSDGRVFIANNLSENNKAEMFDPMLNEFKVIDAILTENPNKHKFNDYFLNQTILLKNERILLLETGNLNINRTLIYDIKTKQLENIGSMNIKDRAGAELTKLNDGNILITGGSRGIAETLRVTKTAEIFDTKKKKFYTISSMNFKRAGHSAILLKSGSVLITGGYYNNNNKLKSAEIFIPKVHKGEQNDR